MQRLPGHPPYQANTSVNEDNAVEQVKDLNIPMLTYPPLALFDPPQITTTFLIYPFPPQETTYSYS